MSKKKRSRRSTTHRSTIQRRVTTVEVRTVWRLARLIRSAADEVCAWCRRMLGE